MALVWMQRKGSLQSLFLLYYNPQENDEPIFP